MLVYLDVICPKKGIKTYLRQFFTVKSRLFFKRL